MAGLTFSDSHNMVAYLEKSIENADFAEIINFLNANLIRYALTVSPTIYVSCIEQFWYTPKIKTVNNETHIHVKVKGKTILISESSVRRDLQFNDQDDEIVAKEREDRMERATTTASSLEAKQDSGNIDRTQSMATLNEPSPHGTSSGSGPMCQDTILGDAEAQTRVLDLKTTKTAQAKEIVSLKKKVKKLERKRKSKTLGMNLFKIGTSSRRSLGEEDAYKQGRNLKQGKHSSIFEGSDFDEEFDANMDEAIKQVYDDNKDTIKEGEVQVPTADMEVNTASGLVTTAGVSVSTAKHITTAEPTTPPTTTTTIFEDEDLTIAQTLMKMRSEKSKVREMVMQEPSETAIRPTVPPQQHNPKDKGKGKMMQAEVKEEERLEREREKDANITEWDNVQAMIDVDYELAARLQAQEQEELTIKERSKLFVELMDKRKKHFARLRAEEQRRKPLTKAQKRNQMYSFVPMDSEVVKGSKDRAEGSKTRAEGSSKRAGEDLQQESAKKQKMDDDKEKEELKKCFEIVLDDGDDVTIDATPLSVKIPIIDYKIYQEGNKSFFQIIRADGKTQMYLTFSKMLKNFDREDLEVLWRIVKARFKKTEPVNYMDTFLHLNLKTMFEHHVEDSIWKNQQGLKMYPLTKHTLHQMFNNVKLQVDYESEMAYELLRLVKKQLKEGYVPA
ncbi:hypothetical protein Tco_1563820 [Tanacetum coccineum]